MDIGTNYAHLYARNCNNKKEKIYKKNVVRTKNRTKPVNSLDGLLHYQKPHGFMDARPIIAKDPCMHAKVRYADRYIIDLRKRQEFYREQFVAKQRKALDGVHAVTTQEKDVRRSNGHMDEKDKLNLFDRIQNTYDAFSAYRRSLQYDISFDFVLSPTRLWQLSLTGAMIFGMISMSFIYRNLGQNVLAKEEIEKEIVVENDEKTEEIIVDNKENEKTVDAILEEKEEKNSDKKEEKAIVDNKEKNIDSASKKEEKKDVEEITEEKEEEKKEIVQKKPVDSIVKEIEKVEDEKENENIEEGKKDASERTLEELAYETVDGYPIEKMLPYILEQDPEVAKYLIAIAKQESGWGKRVPVLNGQDCYNYWGYRGIRRLMGTGGHTCFNSRKDAVETVGKRLEELIYKYDRKTANRLIVWKCGSSCEGHSPEGVNRWIGVVDSYYDKLSLKK
jgi:hypothetical protein